MNKYDKVRDKLDEAVRSYGDIEVVQLLDLMIEAAGDCSWFYDHLGEEGWFDDDD